MREPDESEIETKLFEASHNVSRLSRGQFKKATHKPSRTGCDIKLILQDESK